jgi:purine-binding chemotaxis protein CheW
MSTGAERQLVVFSLHGEYYGLPIDIVREIIPYTAPSATAAASGLIRGMINWRGTVLPVIDLSLKLGRENDAGERNRILVLEVGNGTLGLIVESVDQVMRIPEAQIEPLPVAGNEFGDEIAAIGDRLVFLLDSERALGSALPPKRPATPRRTTTGASAKTPASPRRRRAPG